MRRVHDLELSACRTSGGRLQKREWLLGTFMDSWIPRSVMLISMVPILIDIVGIRLKPL